MFHVCSLQSMVEQCEFNEFHRNFIRELQPSLLHLSSCQLIVITSLIESPSITKEDFTRYLSNLHPALESLRSTYIKGRIHRVENALESGTDSRSEDHLSHAFFLFQLGAIVRLLIQATTIDLKDTFTKEKDKKKRRSLKEWLKPQWPRLFSAIKSVVIIGVGSIFVMVPRLATTFENGQWVLIAICMTQGDTVGGAFTTMKKRLVGTLLGKFHIPEEKIYCRV
jgi:uncharacterized membrane protein YccC